MHRCPVGTGIFFGHAVPTSPRRMLPADPSVAARTASAHSGESPSGVLHTHLAVFYPVLNLRRWQIVGPAGLDHGRLTLNNFQNQRGLTPCCPPFALAVHHHAHRYLHARLHPNRKSLGSVHWATKTCLPRRSYWHRAGTLRYWELRSVLSMFHANHQANSGDDSQPDWAMLSGYSLETGECLVIF